MKQTYKIQKAIIKWFGTIMVFKHPMFVMFGSYHYKLKGDEIRKILTLRKPGDILLRRYDHYLSGLMIPGYWTHTGYYQGNNRVIHMLGEGITNEDILTFCRCDNLAIIRCMDKDLVKKSQELIKEELKKNVQYDFAFNTTSPKRFYCSELSSYIFQNPKLDRKRKDYILPDDLLSLPKYGPYKLIYQTRKIK